MKKLCSTIITLILFGCGEPNEMHYECTINDRVSDFKLDRSASTAVLTGTNDFGMVMQFTQELEENTTSFIIDVPMMTDGEVFIINKKDLNVYGNGPIHDVDKPIGICTIK